jgi:hypothetical protein
MDRPRSGVAVGFTYFAVAMMFLIGSFHLIAGLTGIFENEIYSVVPAVGTEQSGDAYFLQFDVTTWGWIHAIAGVVVLIAGFALLSGAVWARTIGVILAGISAIANFAWLPWYPIWSIVMIAVSVTVIWALTVHGRDVTME